MQMYTLLDLHILRPIKLVVEYFHCLYIVNRYPKAILHNVLHADCSVVGRTTNISDWYKFYYEGGYIAREQRVEMDTAVLRPTMSSLITY